MHISTHVRKPRRTVWVRRSGFLFLFSSLVAVAASAADPTDEPASASRALRTSFDAAPHPADNPQSPRMLAGEWVPTEAHRIDFSRLPRVPSRHAVVSDVREIKGVNQHNYLVHFQGRFWAMWSDGPGIEDRVGQRVKFATSPDGLAWSEPEFLTPEPPESGPASEFYGTRTDRGFRWISRGFWQRADELFALASWDEAAGFFGPSLQLRAWRLNPADRSWSDAGVVFDNAINNFPPKQLPGGDWMMSRRPYDYKQTGVHFLVGGTRGIDQWESFPVLGSSSELAAEEPLWWVLPDGHLTALFRDNRRSGYVYRSFSTDNGRTWSQPTRTNFPDATSKLHGLRLSDGRYVLISNANPRRRDPLVLSISDDGLVFTKMAYLVGGRHVDYPHAIEHDGHLLVAFAGGKQSVEVLKIRLADLAQLDMPASLELPESAVESRQSSAAWIDLGEEGRTLYVVAEATVPPRGSATELILATSSGQERVRVGIDASGRLRGWLYRAEAVGAELKAGETVSLLIRIHSHRSEPDELLVTTGPAGRIPAEPEKADAWLLGHREGRSDANLARLLVGGEQPELPFRQVRIAEDYARLAASPLLDDTLTRRSSRPTESESLPENLRPPQLVEE